MSTYWLENIGQLVQSLLCRPIRISHSQFPELLRIYVLPLDTICFYTDSSEDSYTSCRVNACIPFMQIFHMYKQLGQRCHLVGITHSPVWLIDLFSKLVAKVYFGISGLIPTVFLFSFSLLMLWESVLNSTSHHWVGWGHLQTCLIF